MLPCRRGPQVSQKRRGAAGNIELRALSDVKETGGLFQLGTGYGLEERVALLRRDTSFRRRRQTKCGANNRAVGGRIPGHSVGTGGHAKENRKPSNEPRPVGAATRHE